MYVDIGPINDISFSHYKSNTTERLSYLDQFYWKNSPLLAKRRKSTPTKKVDKECVRTQLLAAWPGFAKGFNLEALFVDSYFE